MSACRHCRRRALAYGLCSTHLMRQRSGLRMSAPVREQSSYSAAVVRRAVKLAREAGVRPTALELGIPRTTLQHWLHGRRRAL